MASVEPSLWNLIICRLVRRLFPAREYALVMADQSRQDSAGQMSRVRNLPVQVNLADMFVEDSWTLRRPDHQKSGMST
jgi:hypothetical protein